MTSNEGKIAIKLGDKNMFCKVTLANVFAVEEESGISILFPIGDKQISSMPPLVQNLHLLWVLMRSGHPKATKDDAIVVLRDLMRSKRLETILPEVTAQYQGILRDFVGEDAPAENPTEEKAVEVLGDGLNQAAA